MPVAVQILAGSAMILICAAIHILAAGFAIRTLRRAQPFRDSATMRAAALSTSLLFLLLLFAHTVQIYLWALAFWVFGALTGYEAPIYFALVTYSTLGYGDITLAPEFRIFGAMASVCGVLMFGLTTAFLVGVFARILTE
ncbi:two pore domain potassium channel family protein [Maribius pontilimi]|uniref:Two pore domain potassium channel family protein n=1 Tax=Palleronia pontilimi TaxID=1964209 RepID=A0A934IJV3_9RHOB|nr:ion channel [Palleronia pontilimi]MBJ3764263.1 two pore domain potassium channel family protein [Palleronia pontilimi]